MRKARLIDVLKSTQIPMYQVECPYCEMVQLVAQPKTMTEDKDHIYNCDHCGDPFTVAPFKEGVGSSKKTRTPTLRKKKGKPKKGGE